MIIKGHSKEMIDVQNIHYRFRERRKARKRMDSQGKKKEKRTYQMKITKSQSMLFTTFQKKTINKSQNERMIGGKTKKNKNKKKKSRQKRNVHCGHMTTFEIPHILAMKLYHGEKKETHPKDTDKLTTQSLFFDATLFDWKVYELYVCVLRNWWHDETVFCKLHIESKPKHKKATLKK
ncbi:hypothetical protein RFI_06479 [Reticulomyxa filosa]|uniref:Uncharacterized protein n=1 Tax=Reticulomyxa filosa TaxID=46433 RepID=X6NXM8_RETFI|nr:hypothetical protein RFI_06479 [Reticulomyxa filosa]|eukprot:ETO30638.1 hypothetical protein RFI_06479 [Reticulomyxa filosa]